MGELGLETLTTDILTPRQLAKTQQIQAEFGGGRGRQKGCWGQFLASIFHHLYSLCPFNFFLFIPLTPPLVELSPGAPALFSEAAAHLKKLELDTAKAAGPWPALHININKVPRTEAE